MITSYRQHLISTIEGYISQTGIKPTRLGLDAVNDANFVKRLRGGQKIGLNNADKVLTYIAEHPPAVQSQAAA